MSQSNWLFILKNTALTLGALEGVALVLIGFNIVIFGTRIPELNALYIEGLIGGGVIALGAALYWLCYSCMDMCFFSLTRWEVYKEEFLARIITLTFFLGGTVFAFAGLGGSGWLFLVAVAAFVIDRYLVYESRENISQFHRF